MKRNSLKLDTEVVGCLTIESYKQIPESHDINNWTINSNNLQNSNMVREKNVDNVEDGADESMLQETEKEKLALKDEVQFISGDQQNGNAKINIGAVEKGFTGMTKEELMKYANDPFWVRLRWIFFILFWGLWIAMLVGAILIIVGAPKCSAPVPLSWYKQGPLIPIEFDTVNSDQIAALKAVGAKGVIYEVAADETYLVNVPAVQDKIKKLVDDLKSININVIVDLTPNFVTKDDELFVQALKDQEYRSAFAWVERQTIPTNWLSKQNGSAWNEIKPENFVLNQFGNGRYDLQMNSTLAKAKFIAVLETLTKIGVKGFRLNNAKHLIISKELKDEVASSIPNTPNNVHTDYDFWTHTQTTYQSGLGDLLFEFASVIKNATNNEGFLSVTEHIERPEAFMTSTGLWSIELPIYGLLPHTLASDMPGKAKRLHNELTEIVSALGNSSWAQWNYELKTLEFSNVELSEYNTFLMLLPGVPVAPIQALTVKNKLVPFDYLKGLEEIRLTPSYMHGSFNAYTDANYTVIAYTRIKSGNPGYFVAYNPTDVGVSSNFANVKGMPDQLTVHMFSENYKIDKITEKVKVQSSSIPIAARSVIILTYVPKTTE